MSTRHTPASGVTLIAVTGGPSAGKTEFMKRVQDWLSEYGLRVAVIHEAATQLINAGHQPHEKDFQEHVLGHILEAENEYIIGLRADSVDVLICDRGALDALAYVSRQKFVAVAQKHGMTIAQLRNRYKAVVHLVTAADGAEQFYTTENNSARTETPQEACARDVRTQAAWIGHPHHSIIDNSTDFGRKMERALLALARVLHMPIPIEREHKYVPEEFDISWLDAFEVLSVTKIRQTYLLDRQKGYGHTRVRSEKVGRHARYVLTRKTDTGRAGEREEDEREISKKEYERLRLEKADPKARVIIKTRYRFTYEGRLFELDLFGNRLLGRVLLEVEVPDMNEAFKLPPGWHLKEVTGDRRYDNYQIAREGWPKD